MCVACHGNAIAMSFRMKDARGSTLVEALVATLILTTGLLAMAELVRVATVTNTVARNNTLAGILAEQKIEQLRSLAWEFDANGIPLSDAGLQASSASLQQNTPGFVDHLDGGGQIVGRVAQPPASAVYTRRWAIEPMPTSTGPTVLIQVLVTSVRNRGRADQGSVSRLPGEARLMTLKARKPR
jgi:type II secretory pathway pseudopilin PulG